MFNINFSQNLKAVLHCLMALNVANKKSDANIILVPLQATYSFVLALGSCE